MAIINPFVEKQSLVLRKKQMADNIYGRVCRGWSEYGAPYPSYFVFKIYHSWKHRHNIVTKYYKSSNPHHPNILPRQAVYTAAVLAWQALTAPQKAVYNKRALGKYMSGWNLFCHDYLVQH
jgi:hypothetical protein